MSEEITEAKFWRDRFYQVSIMNEKSMEIIKLLMERANKKEWVGIDEDRVAYLADKYAPPIDPAFTKDDDYWRFYQEIEAELKEKNA